MSATNSEKKRIEAYMLAAARSAGVPIPVGEIPGEEPDFTFQTKTGALGIEVTELLRPGSSNHGIVPVAQENFHAGIIAAAQAEYYRTHGARPVYVQVYFADARGKKKDSREMARALADFVAAKAGGTNPFAAFMGMDVPDGFGSITINSLWAEDWWSGEHGGYNVCEIRSQLSERIASKDELLPTYRANLPQGAKIWLLIYSSVTVARSMSIPHGIEEWKFPFGFDRVFWFTALENQFVEIHRAGAVGKQCEKSAAGASSNLVHTLCTNRYK